MPEQPSPRPNDQPSMHDLLVRDVLDRKQLGLARYGTILQPFNGRDQLQDCYEELLDHLVYVKAAIIERDGLLNQLGRARLECDHLREALDRQRELNLSLAERCRAQSEALSGRAERADLQGRAGGEGGGPGAGGPEQPAPG